MVHRSNDKAKQKKEDATKSNAKKGAKKTEKPPPKRSTGSAKSDASKSKKQNRAAATAATKNTSSRSGKKPNQPQAPPAAAAAAKRPGTVSGSTGSSSTRAAALKALRTGLDCLRLSAVDTRASLLGREEHVGLISDFLSSDVNRTLVLFGMPGTGKTAAVKHALANVPDHITAVFLNGYVIQKASDVYVSLYRELSRDRLGKEEVLTAQSAALALEKRFTYGWSGAVPMSATTGVTSAGGGGAEKKQSKATAAAAAATASSVPLCVIVVDEMDKCIDSSNRTLFKLIDWTMLPHAHCRLITIANSMHLPEKMDGKTRSRLSTTRRITFQPYAEHELLSILQQRIGHIKPALFSPKALTYICKQIANHNGDVRRLLQTTASAVHQVQCAIDDGELALSADVVLKNNGGIVQVAQLHSVVKSILHDRLSEFVASVDSIVMFLTLCCLSRESRNRDAMEIAPCVDVMALFQHTKAALAQYGHVVADGILLPSDDGDGHDDDLEAFILRQQQEQGMYSASTNCVIDDMRLDTWLRTLDTLREVGLCVLSSGEEEVVVDRAGKVLSMSEPVSVTLVQPCQTLITQCQVHPIHGPKVGSVFFS